MGPPLPWDRTGMPEGSRKWASLSFYRGQRQASTVGASQKIDPWEKTHKSTHAASLSLHGTLGWMKTALLWQYNLGVPHHVIAVVSALLISALPLGLYNWRRDCWQHWPCVYPRPPSWLSQSRLQTNTRGFVLIRQICETQHSFISWRLPLRWGDKVAFLISPNSSQ